MQRQALDAGDTIRVSRSMLYGLSRFSDSRPVPTPGHADWGAVKLRRLLLVKGSVLD